MQQLIGQRNKVCKLRARRARTRKGKPLADDQHSSTHDSSHNRRRHADWCPTRNQNKARAHALAKSADLEPSQPPPVQLGVQLIDRTQNFTRSSREGSIPIAWGWVGKLRPKAGGSKKLPCSSCSLWAHNPQGSRASNPQRKVKWMHRVSLNGKALRTMLELNPGDHFSIKQGWGKFGSSLERWRHRRKIISRKKRRLR